MLLIGTDPEEWWTGHDTIARIISAQLSETGGFHLEPGEFDAFSEGKTGWFADRATLRMTNGDGQIRMTAVLHDEGGSWKIVQMHWSMGVPNADTFGQELTTH